MVFESSATVTTMAMEERLALQNTQVIEGQTLVRRFTDSLDGTTTLEQAVISAQEEDDRLLEDSHETKMRA